MIAGRKVSVTIALPTYNRVAGLEKAIKSVLAQDFQHWELFICDNASSDGTEEVAAEFAANDSRVRHQRQTENRGS